MTSQLAWLKIHPVKALWIDEFGKPEDVLRWGERASKQLDEGEVRLKVLAAPINPADLNLVEGTYGVRPDLPTVPGIEGCGEVLESRSRQFSPGDRCMVLHRAGMWAEEVVLPESSLIRLPEGIDPLQAAMLKVNPATAYRMLKGFTDLPQGGWVVQNAANSGVGRCVIQLARSLGWRTINLVRRESLVEELKALGADHVLVDEPAAIDQVKEWVGDDPPMLAFNAVGGDSALRQMNMLGREGVHITYGAMAKRPLKIPNSLLIFKNLQIRGYWLTRWIDQASEQELQETYGYLANEVLGGRLTVPVDSTHSLENHAEALKRVSSSDRLGKVLFRMS